MGQQHCFRQNGIIISEICLKPSPMYFCRSTIYLRQFIGQQPDARIGLRRRTFTAIIVESLEHKSNATGRLYPVKPLEGTLENSFRLLFPRSGKMPGTRNKISQSANSPSITIVQSHFLILRSEYSIFIHVIQKRAVRLLTVTDKIQVGLDIPLFHFSLSRSNHLTHRH